MFARTYHLDAVSLRYFNVYGPAQDSESSYTGAIAIFMNAVLDGKRIVVDGDGTQTKDFTYVGNVVQANLLAAAADGIAGEVFNVACGVETSVNEVIGCLTSLQPGTAEVMHGPPRPGDIRHSRADISRARRLLGYEPQTYIEEGLRHTLEWYRASRKR